MNVGGGRHEDALISLAASLRFEDLPDSVIEATAALVLDQFTCALLGLEMPWTQSLWAVLSSAAAPVATATGGSGVAFVYGDGLAVSPETAALVNGTAAHGFDLDDLHFGTMSHPGCVVIPAAIAVALASGARGRALIAAVAAGYEPMLRTGLAAGLQYGEAGWHATGVLGPLGSATAAGRLLSGTAEVDGEIVRDAIQLAASLGSGIKAFNEFGPGMVKRLHAGRAAESGILAARLARGGYRGPRYALTARFGLANVLAMGSGADVTALDRDLGERFLVEDVYIKPYAACGAVHGAVLAAELIAREWPQLREPDVREVVIGTAPRSLAQNSNTEPADVMAVQYSAEASVAIALLGGALDPWRFIEAANDAEDPARKLARRIRMEVNDEASRSYPDPNEGVVVVTRADGTEISRRGSSTPASSKGWEVAVGKLRAVSARRLSDAACDELIAAVQALADDGPVSDCLTPLLRSADSERL